MGFQDDGCECEYCCNEGEKNKCWALKHIDELKSDVEKLTSTHTTNLKLPPLEEIKSCLDEALDNPVNENIPLYEIVYNIIRRQL
jgi:hypothetical protein